MVFMDQAVPFPEVGSVTRVVVVVVAAVSMLLIFCVHTIVRLGI